MIKNEKLGDFLNAAANQKHAIIRSFCNATALLVPSGMPPAFYGALGVNLVVQNAINDSNEEVNIAKRGLARLAESKTIEKTGVASTETGVWNMLQETAITLGHVAGAALIVAGEFTSNKLMTRLGVGTVIGSNIISVVDYGLNAKKKRKNINEWSHYLFKNTR